MMLNTRWKHRFVQALLGLHVLGWLASAFQAVQLKTVSKAGVSETYSADMMPTVFMLLSLAVMSAAVTWWVRTRNPTALAVAFASFGVIGVAGLAVGGLLVFASFGETDPYFAPVGALACVVGLVHGVGALFALNVRNDVQPVGDSE